ncbi:OmpA/MotB family protein [Pedobacter flavus]|uniref:OmpA family protein n=1 Tax=Pedobacter flavus TaxID=3113906 RepID=A0ABU7GYM2_9SPHI|nr:OmpA family protein [Pedobacter sp. VNH31]MEE1884149.1 OmpA family protein [Pedobacter sp. VNH31]
MKHSILISTISLLLFLSSCVILSPKKYNSLLAKQDSLSKGWGEAQVKIEDLEKYISKLRYDTTVLNGMIKNLKSELEDSEVKLNALKTNSNAEINKLLADLKVRESRLKEVEEILNKREEASQQLKEKLQNALLGFTKNGLSVELKNGKVYVSLTDKLLFPSGSIIIDERGKQALTGLAEVLKQQPEINIAVEGHTDNQKVNNLGQIKDNWDLSVLRATSVVRFLTEVTKVEQIRMTATGKGEFQPLVPNVSSEDRSKNRRIEIVLSPKLDELYELIKK